MDRGFQIITDSTCDLPKSWLAEHPYVTVMDVPVIVTRGAESHILRNLGPDDFFTAETFVKQGFRASTSHPTMYAADGDENIVSVEQVVRKNAEAGRDVIYVVMNSALSGAFGTATPLFAQLQDEYKGRGRRILCVDSQCMSTGLALLLMDIAKNMDNGYIQNVDQVATFVQQTRGHIGHYFTWGELSYIKKSGRVNAVGALIGTLLNMRLVCSAQYCEDGERRLEHLTPSRHWMIKIRGINKWAQVVGAYAKKHIADPRGTVIIAHGNVLHDAEKIHNQLLPYLPDADFKYGEEWRCGAGIQAHGGPTSIHVNFHVDKIESLADTVKEVEGIVRNLNW
jgi:DegV family protein with EDD domain